MGKANITQEEKDNIIKDYLNKMNQKDLCKKYHHNDRTIRKILKEAEVHKTLQETNISKYYINSNIFDINNQSYNGSYIMGLISTDGCISNVDNQIYIELQRTDRELLEKVNLALENERPVKDYTNHSKNYDNSKIYFYNKKIKEDLKKYNIVTNKTYSSEYKRPEGLLKEYYWSHIRGMFDGDGTIYTTTNHSTFRIDTVSEDIANWLVDVFKQENITLNINIENKKNINVYRCSTSEKASLIKIYNLFYNNDLEKNPIYMKRKFEKFSSIVK